MSGRHSAGLLVHRRRGGRTEVLLGHMGGPFWATRDAGAWSIPKGEPARDEPDEPAARREFEEELGLPVPPGPLVGLGTVRQAGGKTVAAWAVEGEIDPATVTPGTFELEWPPRSGRSQTFPELDRVAWFGLDEAAAVIVTGQRALLDRLRGHLGDHLAGTTDA